MKKVLILLIIISIIGAALYFAHKPKIDHMSMKINDGAIQALEQFKSKGKFVPNEKENGYAGPTYTGLGDKSLTPILTRDLNLTADDFITTIKNSGSESDFQEVIKNGLARFNSVYIELDTEDRERIARYFEELMDIVGIQSSNGQLNEWMYGFNPEATK